MTTMHPVMKVNRTFVDHKPHYELVLSPENFNFLCAGAPGADALVGMSPGGTEFYLFPHPFENMPESFRLMPDAMGYFAYLGAEVPTLPGRASDEDFDVLAQQASDNLERAINESINIPIIEETSVGTLTMGYVTMRVEKENSQKTQETQ
ncbi:hypothetical protein GOV04_02715 [Candidatus Woesearchaeota archaeon]|nr:hypothetical protein [Candidatus Woesearchaeota archaeon]